MNIETFISVLVLSAASTSLATEVVKIILEQYDVEFKSMPLAVVIAFVVGVAEMVIYSIVNGISECAFIYAICTGIANVIGSTTSYDTAKALIYALFGKSE